LFYKKDLTNAEETFGKRFDIFKQKVKSI